MQKVDCGVRPPQALRDYKVLESEEIQWQPLKEARILFSVPRLTEEDVKVHKLDLSYQYSLANFSILVWNYGGKLIFRDGHDYDRSPWALMIEDRAKKWNQKVELINLPSCEKDGHSLPYSIETEVLGRSDFCVFVAGGEIVDPGLKQALEFNLPCFLVGYKQAHIDQILKQFPGIFGELRNGLSVEENKRLALYPMWVGFTLMQIAKCFNGNTNTRVIPSEAIT